VKSRIGPGRGPHPRLQKFWDARAACNYIGGGTGTGLLIIAALYSAIGYPVQDLLLVGLAAIAFGLFMVFLEIGRPWRSANLLFHPQSSWMTREGIVGLFLFPAGGLGLLLAGTVPGEAATLVAGVLAAAYLYCQMRMKNACKGILAWCDPALMPYMVVTGVVEGLGIAVCLPAMNGNPVAWLTLAILLCLRAFLWLAYERSLHRNRAPSRTCEVIDDLRLPYVLAGHLIPALLLLFAAGTSSGLTAMLGGLLAAGTGWYAKLMIVTRAAQTRGFAIPRTPVRGMGVSRVLSSP